MSRWWRLLAPARWASPLEFLPGILDVFSSNKRAPRPSRRVFVDKNGNVTRQEERDDR